MVRSDVDGQPSVALGEDLRDEEPEGRDDAQAHQEEGREDRLEFDGRGDEGVAVCLSDGEFSPPLRHYPRRYNVQHAEEKNCVEPY